MIYELWMWKNNPTANAAYAKITEEEQKALDEALEMEKYGAKWVLYCESTWANEQYRNWGITSYETLEGRIAQTRALEKAGWFQIAEIDSLMGMLDGGEAITPPTFPNPIYRLWIEHANPVTYANYAALSNEEEKALWDCWKESMDRTGACIVLFCNSAWCDGGRPKFGVAAFPSLEACMEHTKDCEKLKFPLYYDIFELMGVPV